MTETFAGCALASTDSTPRSTKVPVEISSVRPEPGKIALKAPRRTKPPKHIADFDMAGVVNSSRNWDTSPSVHRSSQSTISNDWLTIRRR